MIKRVGAVLVFILLSMSLPLTKAEASEVKLLFAYKHGCPHCEYQKPIINDFMDAHPEIAVKMVEYYKLNSGQKSLIRGTEGHPVLVFYSGKCKRQVVGRTSSRELEQELKAFKESMGKCLSTATGSTVTTGSRVVCY